MYFVFFYEMKIFGQRNYISSSTLWCLMDLLRMTESFLEKIFRSVCSSTRPQEQNFAGEVTAFRPLHEPITTRGSSTENVTEVAATGIRHGTFEHFATIHC